MLMHDFGCGLVRINPRAKMFYASSAIEADNLARLALNAATQLDAIKRGKTGDLSSLRAFGDAIAQFSGVDDAAGAGAYWLDPSSSEIFSTAIASVTNRNISHIDTLNNELLDIVGRLRDVRQGEQSIDSIKKFCLEVHSFILRARMTAGLHERGVFDYDQSFSG